jgi:hypothetical protein
MIRLIPTGLCAIFGLVNDPRKARLYSLKPGQWPSNAFDSTFGVAASLQVVLTLGLVLRWFELTVLPDVSVVTFPKVSFVAPTA